MTLLIVLICVTIGTSFLCSMMEASLLSITPTYVARLEEKNPALFRKLSFYKANIDTPLSAILALNTIANTAGAAGIGAQVSVVYGSNYVALASALMTVAILICSEIIPKTLGATHWRSLVGFLCFMLSMMIFVLKPFLKLSEMLIKLISPPTTGQSDIREEIKALTKLAYTENYIDDDENRVICNTLNLHDVKARDVATPRNVCSTVLAGISIREFIETATQYAFSRFPVMKNEDEETFVGYIHKSDIIGKDPTLSINTVMRPILEVASTSNIDYVFTEMLKTRNHIGVVYDELGTWLGIITLEDVLETILGKEILDETDKVIDMRSYAKLLWSNKKAKAAEKRKEALAGKPN